MARPHRRQAKQAAPEQAEYTRGCMLLLFHKSLYEHKAEPVITDAEYDCLERWVEGLEQHPNVTAHPASPTHKSVCPMRAKG